MSEGPLLMTSPAAMSRLPQDILWHTFYFVAQPPKMATRYFSAPSGLHDLRHVSHVCASWRGLVLASTSLWGMSIELMSLSHSHPRWRNEVLRRTGQSLLDIQGYILTDGRESEVLQQFLALLLNKHWPRMRKLDITFNAFERTAGRWRLIKAMHKAFQKSAPRLESFSIDLGPSNEFLSGILRLFAEQAPLLSTFSAEYFRIHPQSALLSNLRVLRLTCHWTAHQLLTTLTSIPFLEDLSIRELEEGNAVELSVIERKTFPRVGLPKLKELEVYMGKALGKYLEVLEHLVLPTRLGILLECLRLRSLVQANLLPVQRVLASYLHHIFQEELPTYLEIDADKHYILLSLSVGSDTEFTFNFNFKYETDMTMFLDLITSISLERCTTFNLNTREGALVPTNTTITRTVLPKLTSVNKLYIIARSLQLLPTDGGSVLLPALEHLRLDGRHEVEPVLNFLSSRKTLGVPIQVLDLNRYMSASNGDFRSLELRFVGLKVSWHTYSPGYVMMIHEYICGSGNPEVLDFSPK